MVRFSLKMPENLRILVALYRAMRLRFGYGFESCDANDPRNVKNTYLAKKHRPVFLPPLLLVGSRELVLKVPKQGQFHAAIRVTRKRCDSWAEVALGTRTVSRRNSLKTLTSLNKEVRPFFLCDNSIWGYPSVSSLSDYSIWRS